MAGKPIDQQRKQVITSQVPPETHQAADSSRVSPANIVSEQFVAEQLTSEDDSTPAYRESTESNVRPKKRMKIRRTSEERRNQRRQVASEVARGIRFLAAPLMWVCLLAFCGGTGIAALLWLTSLPPLPDCKQLSAMSIDADKLYCAEQAARSGKVDSLLAGMTLVKDWSADHPLYRRANDLMGDWSTSLMIIANDKASQNDLQNAIALAKKIPPSSPTYKEVQGTIADWQKILNRGKEIEKRINAALKAQDWKTATEQLQALFREDNDYWQQHTSRLQERIATERTAREQLQQARQVGGAAAGNTEMLGRAIVLANQVAPSSYARADAEIDIARWSQLVFKMVAERLNRADYGGAIAAADALPSIVTLPQEVRNQLWFSRAQLLAKSKPAGVSPAESLWQVWVTLPQLHQIAAASPLYRPAQPLISQLEQQIQDLSQLQVASFFANVKQVPTLQLATGAAQAITVDRPQRLYAQTLIAQWRKEIQQIEDRPLLVQAQQFAAKGTVPHFRAAISLASQIAPGRALRLEAQTAIADWTLKIQTLEDQPVLDLARAFAKQDKLKEAIQVASKIRPNRTLYATAQAEIGNWITQIQIAEDRPIIDQAQALADQGNLTAAINLALQIAPDRALYGEAQTAISRWTAQRAAIVRERQLESNNSNPEEQSESNPDDSGYSTYPESAPGYSENREPESPPPEPMPELPPP